MTSMLNMRLLTILLVVGGLLVFLGANVHLLVVALQSQPECVAHAKVGDAAPGEYSAAKSAC